MRRWHRAPRTPAALLAALALLLGAVGKGRADLVFSTLRAELGEIRSGARLGYSFSFVNRGTEPVEIVEARPGCGCLRPRLERLVFRPGEEGTIPLEVNALGQSAGPHTWRLLLRYRAGAAEREVNLEVAARVVTEVTLQPAALTLVAERPVSQEIVLTDLRPTPLAITHLAVSSPHLTVRLTDQGRNVLGHWAFKLRLDLGAEYPEGRHTEVLVVHTSDPDYRELQVPLTVVKRPRPRLTAVPGAVELRPAGARFVRLTDRDGQKVVIEDVTADDPALQCRWAAGPENCATVKVQLDGARLPGGNRDSAVRVRVSAPVRETLVIPVRCLADER
ncbi:MAG: DUF1573 domain-containing protein [Gemmataceae bacterium]|nr:DUF1573 domain-containing protein [Gemmataceae bacterium]